MRLAIVSQQGGKAAGAEHALNEFLTRFPESIELSWFFFEDGEFARSIREKCRSVTIVQMSDRVAGVKRSALSISALSDVAALVWRLAAVLRAARPNLVLTNSMKAHIIGSLAARIAGLACVNYVHDIVEGRALALLRLVSRVCSVERLACSGAVKRRLDLKKTSIAYAAIDVNLFAALPDREAARSTLGIPNDGLPVVAIVGRLARWKGQDRFVRIAARLSRSTQARFCIIGSALFGVDGDYETELVAMVARAGLRDRVQFIPWQEDMRTVYAAIDISCNCSAREPFGRTSLEALASSVPIVCFDDAGICEVFEQNCGGTRVPAGDEAAFSDALLAYLREPAFFAAAKVAARAAAEALDVRFAYPTFFAAIDRLGSRAATGEGRVLSSD